MASSNLGLRYRKHVPDAPDWTSAKTYYELAVEQSNQQDAEAAYQLGRIAHFAYATESPDYERAAHLQNRSRPGECPRCL